ncbi:MAG: hypothetical protein ACI4MB_06060 [Candidatus Coproplasma sp.]
MAEERLIDTDKDKKYKIRKNADGEDELYIDDSAAEEQVEEVTFLVDEEELEETEENSAASFAYDEENERNFKEKKQNALKAAELVESARKECEKGWYASAVESLEKAIELDGENGEIYALEIVAYTRNFTDYSRIKDAKEYAGELKKYTDKQTKKELFEKSSESMLSNINALSRKVAALSEENEKQKEIRAKKFIADRNKAITFICVSLSFFAVFFGLSTYFFLNIHSIQTNTNLILAIVFTSLEFIALVFTAFILRQLLTACRRVRLNKKNTATKLGREMLANQADLDAFNAIYNALKG